MDDSEIIRLYWERDEKAVAETDGKYGGYLRAIAKNILGSDEDADECVNETYLNAWSSIPPQRPDSLAAFLGRIARNLSLNMYSRRRAAKRNYGEAAATLDELSECVSGRENTESELDARELVGELNAFVGGLPEKKRYIFVRRYWYADSVSKIAENIGLTQQNVSKILERLRKQLRARLSERGFDL